VTPLEPFFTESPAWHEKIGAIHALLERVKISEEQSGDVLHLRRRKQNVDCELTEWRGRVDPEIKGHEMDALRGERLKCSCAVDERAECSVKFVDNDVVPGLREHADLASCFEQLMRREAVALPRAGSPSGAGVSTPGAGGA
jgi:hypothetical protein